MSRLRLTIKGLKKSYAVPVLKDIDLSIEAGQIYGLVGENGAGKSTLINVLCGLVKRDSGHILLNENEYSPNNVAQAMLSGVSVASQELSLIDNLSVAQNISLRKLPSKVNWLDQATINKRATRLLERFGLSDIHPTTLVANLSLAQKQLVELCKALSEPCELLILDEPTAALSQQQSEILHQQMQTRVKQGMSIIYVSHRLDDVIQECDVISVLRDGTLVQTFDSSQATSDLLIEHMSSGLFSAAKKDSSQKPAIEQTTLLAVNNVQTTDLPFPINLEVVSGEIVGLAGLAGAGRTELLEAIYGLTSLNSGTVNRFINPSSNKLSNTKTQQQSSSGTPIKDTAHAVSLGLGMLSEDRKQQGIFAQQSLDFNASIAKLKRVSHRGFNQFLDLSTLQKTCEQLFSKLAVKFSHSQQHIDELSGGNQQKVLLARWLFANTEIFLLDEPTRGVDVATKALIYKELFALKQHGTAIIIASSEIEELFTVCDRVLVMSERKIVGELNASEFDHDKLLSMAFSQNLQASTALDSKHQQKELRSSI